MPFADQPCSGLACAVRCGVQTYVWRPAVDGGGDDAEALQRVLGVYL